MRRIPLLLVALLAIGSSPSATALGADDAEVLVRTLFYEEFPADAARDLGPEGIARLGQMLADPAEVEHHANIVSALGFSGHPAAFGLLQAYASVAPSGEVDRGTFRAWSRLGMAMGHLAQDDPRALAWLHAHAQGAKAPGWSHRHHRGERLLTLLQEQALTGLALSGAPSARRVIDAAASTRGNDTAASRRRAHGLYAQELHGDSTRGRGGRSR